MTQGSIFKPGGNCWRVAHATQATMLIDADSYFRAFVAAARHAKRSLLIAGWDIHSLTRLLPEEGPAQKALYLGEFLNGLVRAHRRLHVHILIWDYPMIFGLDREWPSLYGASWSTHRRIHLRYDDTHLLGGSHHQKIVVIDDTMAFCGGIDLTCRRWDTCDHAANDTRRVVGTEPYPPMHDVALAVQGEAARALGDVVRQRWEYATGRKITTPVVTNHPWPTELAPQFANVPVAVARTLPPAATGSVGVHEIEALYLDMIAAAKECIYIENQYFTADKIGEALARRLEEDEGPEVIIVLRELSHGWLEEFTMQSLRVRLLNRLTEADRHGRLRVGYPFVSGLRAGTCVDVHAKLMIVDDQWLRVGSANVANRSMGLDSECDLCIEARGDVKAAEQIRTLRATLFAEHLGVETAAVTETIERTGSMRATWDALEGGSDRTLRKLSVTPQQGSTTLLDIASVADPERPVALQELVQMFTPEVESVRRGPAWGTLAIVAAVVFGLTMIWRYTPLGEWLVPEQVTGWAKQVGSSPLVVLAVLLAYTPASIIMFPRPLITLFAVVAFGPWLGFTYALSGILLAATATYVAGRALDPSIVRRLAGERLHRMTGLLRRRGLLAITALRLVPIAPFSVEGLAAGAMRIKFFDFFMGTALGMLPGTLTTTVFGDQLQAAIADPARVNYWLIGGVVVLFATGTWAVRRWLFDTKRSGAAA